jgi:hypothetical protein
MGMLYIVGKGEIAMKLRDRLAELLMSGEYLFEQNQESRRQRSASYKDGFCDGLSEGKLKGSLDTLKALDGKGLQKPLFFGPIN